MYRKVTPPSLPSLPETGSPLPITAFALYPHGSNPNESKVVSSFEKRASIPSLWEMASPRTWPGVVEGEEKESESWKKGARAEGERWVMRISRVVSWYVTVEEEENVGIEEEGEGAGRERVQGLGSDGRIGWELGVVRYKSQWSLFIGPTVYAAPAVPIISMLVSRKSLFSFIAVRHMKEIWAFGLTKDAVQKLHFISPIPMRTLLPLWEEKLFLE